MGDGTRKISTNITTVNFIIAFQKFAAQSLTHIPPLLMIVFIHLKVITTQRFQLPCIFFFVWGYAQSLPLTGCVDESLIYFHIFTSFILEFMALVHWDIPSKIKCRAQNETRKNAHCHLSVHSAKVQSLSSAAVFGYLLHLCWTESGKHSGFEGRKHLPKLWIALCSNASERDN